MLVKQISVFLENNAGRLASVTRILGENQIDIRALSIADTTDFGILRIIVSDPEKGVVKLKENGFTANETTIITIAIEDKPGTLADSLELLLKEDIGIEYMYAFSGKIANKALVAIRANDNEKASDIFSAHGIKVLTAEEVYNMI